MASNMIVVGVGDRDLSDRLEAPWGYARLVNYADCADAAALVQLLDAYAQDPAGGGEPLSDFAKDNLAVSLSQRAAFSIIAVADGRPVGLVNCLEGFSTFACQTLVNVHDVAVVADFRGHGVGRVMLELAEREALRRGACKLTLEVLSNNLPARTLYERMGFADYQLSPDMGSACFMQKWLKPPVNHL